MTSIGIDRTRERDIDRGKGRVSKRLKIIPLVDMLPDHTINPRSVIADETTFFFFVIEKQPGPYAHETQNS